MKKMEFNFIRIFTFVMINLIIMFFYLPFIFVFLENIDKYTYWIILFIIVSLGVFLTEWSYFLSVFVNPGY